MALALPQGDVASAELVDPYYIHPAVIAAYLAGGLKPIKEKDDPDPYKLSGEERALLALLGAQASRPTTARSRGGSRRSKSAPSR